MGKDVVLLSCNNRADGRLKSKLSFKFKYKIKFLFTLNLMYVKCGCDTSWTLFKYLGMVWRVTKWQTLT